MPTDFPASVPVIPTSVPDRRLHDATRITHMVICRKVVFCTPPNPPVVILNLFQDNEKPSLVILKQVQDDEWEGDRRRMPFDRHSPNEIYVTASSAASALARRRRVNQMATSAISNKIHKGMASSSCETTSGGVRTAAMANAPTIA